MAMEAFTRTHGILIRKKIKNDDKGCQLHRPMTGHYNHLVHLILFKVVSKITMIDIFNYS